MLYFFLMSVHIGVDVGGTQLRAACYKPNLLSPAIINRIPTQAPGETALDRLRAVIASVMPPGEEVAGIGVAVPGPLDPYEGVLIEAPNIPGWDELPLRKILESWFHLPVALGNDANLATLGEWKYGAGRGHHHMLYLTISTGIGSGIIIRDQLLLGAHGLGAELGHVTVVIDGPPCGCGGRGHLEAVASGPAIARWVRAKLAAGAASSLHHVKSVNAEQVARAAVQGDPLACEALGRAGAFIGQALADFLHIFNPSAVIIGGGVSKSGSALFDPLNASLKSHVLSPRYLQDLVILPAALGDQVGLIGALALARETFP